MVIWRNHNTNNDGFGLTSPGSFGNIVGHQSDTYSLTGSGDSGRMPADILRHEIGHMFLGGNNFHACGGGTHANYWVPDAGGYGVLSGGGSSLLSWSGWDRFRLGWNNPANTELISARDVNNNEVSGDLDGSQPLDAGVYILRDFVQTGDAIRIKLPFINSSSEYEQWLWLENHRGFANNGNDYDRFYREQATSCIDPMEWGLIVNLQIDKNTKEGNGIYSGYKDYLRQYSADGMWERSFDHPTADQCLIGWNNFPRPANRIRPNPLTGRSDLDRTALDLDLNPGLDYEDQVLVSADDVNGVDEYKLFYQGNPRQLFTLSRNKEVSMGTNPSSASRMNQAGKDIAVGTKNVRSVYLNGVKIEILDMVSNGDIKVKIDFDHVDIKTDALWMSPSIVLNEITSSSGYSLVLNSGSFLTLDHGTSATRMGGPIDFEGDDVYTSPTVMNVKANAYVNLESGSELIVDRESKLSLEANSRIDVQNGAILRIKREGILEIRTDAIINVMDGGEIIIENSDGIYGPGILVYEKDARINLNGSSSLIDVNGRIIIGNDAIFRLADMNNFDKTSGKIKFQGGFDNDVEITAGTNAAVNIKGYSKTQEVIINLKSTLDFPDNLIEFSLSDLRLSQGFADKISPPYSNTCGIIFLNTLITNITGGSNNYGVKLYGQQNVKINGCTFLDCYNGIVAQNLDLGNSLVVKNSLFENCDIGILTLSEGAYLKEVDFESCGEPWIAWSTSATSNVYNCTAINSTGINLRYEGASTLLMENSSINGGIEGVSIEQGILKASCNEIRSQTANAIYASINASILMGEPFGVNKLSTNARTIDLYKANSLDLFVGGNDLRPNNPGTQNIINGSLVCSSPATVSAKGNKWKTSGGAPNSTDYNVWADCVAPFSVTYTDLSPITFMEACGLSDPGPGFGRPQNNSDTAYSESNPISSDPDLANGEINIEQFNALILELRSISFYDYLNVQEDNDSSELAPIEEYLENKLIAFNNLTELLQNENFTIQLSNEAFQVGVTEMFSTFVELTTIPDSLIAFQSEDANDVFIKTVSNIDKAIDISGENNGYEFGLRLNKAQAYRIYGDYSTAISEINEAGAIASDESEIMLAEKLNCLFTAESIMVANPEKDEWPEEYSECNYFFEPSESIITPNSFENGLIESNLVSIKVQPNPTNSSILITAIDAKSDIELIEIFDTYGRKVESFNNPASSRLQMGSYSNGVYFIRVRFLDGSFGRTTVLKNN